MNGSLEQLAVRVSGAKQEFHGDGSLVAEQQHHGLSHIGSAGKAHCVERTGTRMDVGRERAKGIVRTIISPVTAQGLH